MRGRQGLTGHVYCSQFNLPILDEILHRWTLSRVLLTLHYFAARIVEVACATERTAKALLHQVMTLTATTTKAMREAVSRTIACVLVAAHGLLLAVAVDVEIRIGKLQIISGV